MRPLLAICLDPMKFLQAFPAGLQAEFADAACAPVPEYLAALMRELDGDRNEHSGEGREYGKRMVALSRPGLQTVRREDGDGGRYFSSGPRAGASRLRVL